MNQFSIPNNQQISSGVATYPGVSIPPQNPGLCAQSTELLRHLTELENNIATLRGKLFGEGETGAAQCEPSSIAGVLATACTRIASLVGETSTILTRF